MDFAAGPLSDEQLQRAAQFAQDLLRSASSPGSVGHDWWLGPGAQQVLATAAVP
ncbi:hypothetical protein HaLaN_21354 [Haematococcus lacustris]|uniref:Uncharacterized protein n=1 Tax=Haematococcus lacustris TaxID=44745 RepID=A0A699ZRE4_HAELA|nr:hypothetical protein HaLaN_21354 [Haematococcus lacustris]